MGGISCHSLRSQKKRSFIQNIEFPNQEQGPAQNLDLPYRHYIHKGHYIPSALPHKLNKFIPQNKRILLSTISKSSIMMRRLIEKKPILY